MSPDGQSMAELFARYKDRLLSWARRLLDSEAQCEDVVQEVMLGLLQAPNVLANVQRLGAWLFGVVQRRCADLVRRDARRRRKYGELPPDSRKPTGPAEQAQQAELLSAVARAVARLPGPLRHAFVRNALDGVPFREVSRETGIPMGTLMARKSKAVKQVRARLKREGFQV